MAGVGSGVGSVSPIACWVQPSGASFIHLCTRFEKRNRLCHLVLATASPTWHIPCDMLH